MNAAFARPKAVALAGFVVLCGALVATSFAAVPAQHSSSPSSSVVLDPDDNYSHASWGGASFSELPITSVIAQEAKPKLEALCDTTVRISRDAAQDFVSRTQRAALMSGATVSLTISLDGYNGTPWGTAANGGAQSWASPSANNVAFGQAHTAHSRLTWRS